VLAKPVSGVAESAMEQDLLELMPSVLTGAAVHHRLGGEPPAFFDDPAGLGLVQTMLDHVHFGVVVVGPQLRVLFANRAALRECARHPVLRIDRSQLVLLESKHHGDFMKALGAARYGRWSLVQLAHGDDRMMLAVLPLWRKSYCEDGPPALVVFSLRNSSKTLAVQFYAQACELTPTEARVLCALGDGLSPHEIAQRHGVAMSTVRTQLGHIRDKTGARSITDLVRTLGSLPPIMPAALNAS